MLDSNKYLIEFYDQCLAVMDLQVFPLESREAKASAVQAVRHVLKDYVNEYGEKLVLDMIKTPTILPRV